LGISTPRWFGTDQITIVQCSNKPGETSLGLLRFATPPAVQLGDVFFHVLLVQPEENHLRIGFCHIYAVPAVLPKRSRI
jgi:hypothetical protein